MRPDRVRGGGVFCIWRCYLFAVSPGLYRLHTVTAAAHNTKAMGMGIQLVTMTTPLENTMEIHQ